MFKIKSRKYSMIKYDKNKKFKKSNQINTN